MKLTCQQAVLALKLRGLSTSAKSLGSAIGVDSRAVATALRAAVNDGRVTITYRKGLGFYRFKRLKAKA